mmetsp:Transcript_17913/g.36036  ORF Transcript_17913/g.36036 Transcript_17913/m.36036 type:complete len:207 (+) Transcript_17913:239-859(+)
MKGVRHYCKSKRMKVKATRDSARKHKLAAHASILRPSTAPEPNAAAAVAQQGGASVCVDHAAKRRVRFAHDTVEHSRLPKDDFLVMVIDGVDFLWATPTAHKSDPESLLELFLRHTMQARAESALCITKEHLRCLLKTTNMPHRFWPTYGWSHPAAPCECCQRRAHPAPASPAEHLLQQSLHPRRPRSDNRSLCFSEDGLNDIPLT